jgi:signal transduction histidine kinase
VDLLKKESLEGKSGEYLEVLDRQSRRLQKLTEDLVEASKASTGNLSVELRRTDVCELLRQAAGEYAERLEAGGLEAVLSAPQEGLFVMADGRLLWRVLDNLLGNACKYSLPGTRVYIDVERQADETVITVKNISRSRLNVDADELMERFVRGESSRTTEGSGLGLNIARSLAELQKGTFRLAVDGDLFKAELRFKTVF